jgi:hypothetical protein
MAIAKNRAIDLLRREARTFEPGLSRFIQSEWALTCDRRIPY